MTLKVKQQIVPASKYNIKCTYPMTPEYVTIHNTANDATAQNEIDYMTRNNDYVSYHYAVDDVQAIQGLPENRNGWHSGDGQGKGNRASIGIEICYSKSGGARYEKAENNGALLTAMILHKYGWGVEKVRTHQQWNGKYCPHRILDKPNGMKNFLAKVQSELNKLKAANSKPAAPKPAPQNKKPQEVIRLFKPTTETLNQEFQNLLLDAQNKGILKSDKWLTEAKAGKLALDDAIALLATVYGRHLKATK